MLNNLASYTKCFKIIIITSFTGRSVAMYFHARKHTRLQAFFFFLVQFVVVVVVANGNVVCVYRRYANETNVGKKKNNGGINKALSALSLSQPWRVRKDSKKTVKCPLFSLFYFLFLDLNSK